MQERHEARLVPVSEAAAQPLPLRRESAAVASAPIPTLGELAAQYRQRGDGKLVLYKGFAPVRVTHCLSTFGMESYVEPE